MSNGSLHILIFQYGDFAEAYRRFAEGGPETYGYQCYTVDYVSALSDEHNVTVIVIGGEAPEQELEPSLRTIGIDEDTAWSSRLAAWLSDRIDRVDRFVCRTPNPHALRWAASHAEATLPIFADLFSRTRPFSRACLRSMWMIRRLRKALVACQPTCVANHNLVASQSIRLLGVTDRAIVPWDWPRIEPCRARTAEVARCGAFRLFYAGALSEPKGVGDTIRALAILNDQGSNVALSLAGPGDTDRWQQFAQSLGVADRVYIMGLLPYTTVREQMSKHDAVVVPSRHDYAEGLPNTIFEALASGSPLIVSDHPAFKGRFEDDWDAIEFRAGNAHSLASGLRRLMDDDGLYDRLRANSPAALHNLYVGVEWRYLLDRFLSDPCNRADWVRPLSLEEVLATRAKTND